MFVLLGRSQNHSAHRGGSHCGSRAHPLGRSHNALLQSLGQNSNAGTISAQVPTTTSQLLSPG